MRGSSVVELLVRILINAAAVFVAVKVVPQIDFKFGSDWWKLLAVAVILALINAYIKPIVKALSFPITLLTLGLLTFVINAAMLLLVALVSDAFKLGFRIADFPPDFTADALVGALLGSIVISVVSVLLGFLDRSRRLAL
jgi:putative membrane protein